MKDLKTVFELSHYEDGTVFIASTYVEAVRLTTEFKKRIDDDVKLFNKYKQRENEIIDKHNERVKDIDKAIQKYKYIVATKYKDVKACDNDNEYETTCRLLNDLGIQQKELDIYSNPDYKENANKLINCHYAYHGFQGMGLAELIDNIREIKLDKL